MNEVIAIAGFFLALFIVVVGAFKKYNIIILTVIATGILALTNQMNLIETFIAGDNSYISGLSGFFADYFFIFLLASILAKYIENSGAARSIANYVIGKTGKDSQYYVLVAIFMISAILTLGGVSLYVAMFVIIPLAKDLFKDLNLSWKLIVTPYLMGSSTFTMTMIPGSPSVQNVIVSQGLNTPLTAAPALGIILAVLTIVWSLWRMRVELNNSRKNGEGFNSKYESKSSDINRGKLPPFWLSISPLVILFVTIIAGSVMEIEYIIIYALGISVMISAVIFHTYLPSHKTALNDGTATSVTSSLNPASAVGFGTVVSVSSGFLVILEFIQSLPLTPLLSLILLTILLQWAIGSSASVLGIVTERFVPMYNLSSYHPEFVHRIVLVSSSYIPPQVGFLLAFYTVTGLSHKESYKDIMITLNGSVLLFTVVGYILGILMY